MKKNIHSFDRIVRLLFATAVAILYFTNTISGALAIALGVATLVLAATAIINFCPIYYALGISTIKKYAQ